MNFIVFLNINKPLYNALRILVKDCIMKNYNLLFYKDNEYEES